MTIFTRGRRQEACCYMRRLYQKTNGRLNLTQVCGLVVGADMKIAHRDDYRDTENLMKMG